MPIFGYLLAATCIDEACLVGLIEHPAEKAPIIHSERLSLDAEIIGLAGGMDSKEFFLSSSVVYRDDCVVMCS